MEIAAARVASFHYTLTDDTGAVLDRSPDAQPLQYLHGAGNIVPGLENALAGRKAGDTLDVTVRPEEAYGLRNESMVQSVPREAFQGIDTIEPGMQFTAEGPGGAMMVTVVSADEAEVRIDGNHPLAGRTLHFAVEIAAVRDATPAEQASGSVDG
ncbi:FKBP-type peptidyl-prolyl cis-trans isomerase [Luteimonas deserti]|uniref:Peptidyl-prolyl cis-trans isomerase n=1 Tax=Luteimonas deserti TaxID=2752306 RepID=A0A7Z0TUV7_9GAMM|nr:peptidylprolyl isomerase [Luteimonas deserti]NYZ63261.1 peptidylprolyl isomerase [Luteimonas deserti]